MSRAAPVLCRTCHGLFTAEDVVSGICLLCATRQQRCHYCGDIGDYGRMYHIPAQLRSDGIWLKRPERWICGRCWTRRPTEAERITHPSIREALAAQRKAS